MKHLKLFQTEAEYTAYKDSDDFVLPNVSYAVDSTKKFYSPLIVESYKMVDLGLPSGLKWADRNIGAASPEDAGLYFQWGDTVGYTAEQVEAGEKTFNGPNYFDTSDNGSTFNKYATDKLTVLEASDDAAYINMGSKYRMPTKADFEELIDNTTVTYIDIEDNEFAKEQAWIEAGRFKGIKLTGINGNSIFIPAEGEAGGSAVWEDKYFLSLWSSELSGRKQNSTYAYYLSDCGETCILGVNTAGQRFSGMPVRGVCN